MRKKEKKSNYKILEIIVLVLIILLSLLFVLKWFDFRNHSSVGEPKEPGSSEISYDNYIYKIDYWLGRNMIIYLLPDDDIRVVDIEEIYDVVPDCNCMEPTGKFNYKEEIIDFSMESKREVIKVFDDLYKRSGKKEFNVDTLDLTNYENRIFLATIDNDEDQITVEKNIDFESDSKDFSLPTSNYKILNSKMLLKNDTKNKIVNKIANYLNDVINKKFDSYNKNSEEILNNTILDSNLGVELKVEFVYAGPYSISFIIKEEGQLGDKDIYNVEGYNFRYNGEIYVFDMRGIMKNYHQMAIEKFKQTEIYFNYHEQLVKNWEQILYNNMFLEGNWYVSDGQINFLIPGDILGLDEATTKIITIDVSDEDFF